MKKLRKKHLYYIIPITVILILVGASCLSRSCSRSQVPASSDNALLSEASASKAVSLSPKRLASYASVKNCSYQKKGELLSLSLTMPAVPQSDDAYIYLFSFELYESEHDFNKNPIARTDKAVTCTLECPYQQEQLFQEFVPAVLLNGKYVPIASGICLDNPEAIAENQDAYPSSSTKKGLLLDPAMLGTPLLTDLGVKHAIYNIPLSMILGETTDKAYPTISYDFKGTTYRFNGAAIQSYDNLFTYLSNIDMISTAIVLNDWNEAYPEMIHPLSRKKNDAAYYYAFNTAEEDGCKQLEAVASFLAKRYSTGEHGLVSGWVIANEINQSAVWNYMDTKDIDYYAAEFEKALRIFYNAVKSNSANARVSFSIDHDWYSNPKHRKNYFNAKELLSAVNEAALKRGNYDWALAIHPYPSPLTRVNYWTESYDKTENAPVVTIMNLNVVTDFLKQEQFLNTNKKVRPISVTELGFSSVSGEKLQAAAFAYCYYIIDNNPYIDTFFMNRQTDSFDEVRQGLAFGIYESDKTTKYIQEVFKDVDTAQAKKHEKFILNILGADSMKEALSWAE